MSKDRPVATDALETLGTAPIPETSGRDAIHLAVEPSIAAERLMPGERVGFVDGGMGRTAKSVGIVDPFLDTSVEKGQRFWLVLFPRQITSLRHVWSHPDFEERAEATIDGKDHSEAWIRAYVQRVDCPGYEELMGRAMDHAKGRTGWDEEYLHFDGSDAHGDIDPLFWHHFEIVTGATVPDRLKAKFFSCSC